MKIISIAITLFFVLSVGGEYIKVEDNLYSTEKFDDEKEPVGVIYFFNKEKQPVIVVLIMDYI